MLLIQEPIVGPRSGIDAPIKSPPAEDLGERFLAEPRRLTAGLPSQGRSDMPLEQTISGRLERRLPLVVIVRIAQVERAGTEGEERTYTDNISAHGACIFSRHPWKLGDAVRVTPANEESTACGKVVYCRKRADDHYDIGVQFQDSLVMWSALRRYGGL